MRKTGDEFQVSTIFCHAADAISSEFHLVKEGQKNILQLVMPAHKVREVEASSKHENSLAKEEYLVELGCQVLEMNQLKSSAQ